MNSYIPGKVYRINEYSVAHIFAAHLDEATPKVYGLVITEYRSIPNSINTADWSAVTGQWRADKRNPDWDLPTLPCEPIGDIPGWGAPAPAYPSTADEIADMVVERLRGMDQIIILDETMAA